MGRSPEELGRYRDDGLLDAAHSAVADAHRDLVRAERDVAFHRMRLARLASGEFPVDHALLARIERSVDQLAAAIDKRDVQQGKTAAALRPIEAAPPRQVPRQVPAKDIAALLAIAQGAKLHQNLVTHRLTVATRDQNVADQFWQHIEIEQDDLTLLAEHHTKDGEHSFYVMHNRAVTWGIPGEPQLVALHLKRDAAAHTFRFTHRMLPLLSMAQSWLIARGCPEDKILLTAGMGTDPADHATRALEKRLRSDGDHFALLTSYTHDADPIEITALLRALDEKAPLPFRVLLEEVDTDTCTHTLREGGFETFEAATQWWEGHWRGEKPPLPTASPAPRHTTAGIPALPVRPAPPRGPRR